MTFLNCLSVFLIVLICVSSSVKCQTPSGIPSIIRGCYLNNFTVEARPPLTLPLLVELLAKTERNRGNQVSLRVLTSSIFHGYVQFLPKNIRRNIHVTIFSAITSLFSTSLRGDLNLNSFIRFK